MASPPPPPTALWATSPIRAAITHCASDRSSAYTGNRAIATSRCSRPSLNYNANYVKANDTAANPTRGGEAASMLMGIPSGSMGISDSYVEQDKYFALYIADDWKVSRS